LKSQLSLQIRPGWRYETWNIYSFIYTINCSAIFAQRHDVRNQRLRVRSSNSSQSLPGLRISRARFDPLHVTLRTKIGIKHFFEVRYGRREDGGVGTPLRAREHCCAPFGHFVVSAENMRSEYYQRVWACDMRQKTSDFLSRLRGVRPYFSPHLDDAGRGGLNRLRKNLPILSF